MSRKWFLDFKFRIIKPNLKYLPLLFCNPVLPARLLARTHLTVVNIHPESEHQVCVKWKSKVGTNYQLSYKWEEWTKRWASQEIGVRNTPGPSALFPEICLTEIWTILELKSTNNCAWTLCYILFYFYCCK